MMKKGFHYLALFVVVLVWGVDPILYTFFYQHYSAAVTSAICTFGSAVLFVLLAIPHLKQLDRRYWKIALPLSLLNALACLLQRIGLQYATPASYAFLEHLSCAVVPVALFFMLRKKPSRLHICASVICLVGCFVLSGLTFSDFSFGVGTLLCALAGIILGITVAGVGAYAQKLNIRLFMMIWMVCYFGMSFFSALLLHQTGLETLQFSADPGVLIFVLVFGFLDVGLCWLFRNNAICHINPIVVALISPLSAVITGVGSVILGTDPLTPNLVIGSVIITVAVILSGIGELKSTDCEEVSSC